MRTVATIVFLLACAWCYAARVDTAEINRLLRVNDKNLDPQNAIAEYDRILLLSKQNNYAHGAFIAVMTKGIKYMEIDDYEGARRCFGEAMQWAPRSLERDAMAWCYSNIGETYMWVGDYDKAAEYLYIARNKLLEANAGPTHNAANVYTALAITNARLKQYDKALQYYHISEQVCRAGNLLFHLAINYQNKGECYLEMGLVDSARHCFNQIMPIGRRIGKVDLEAIGNTKLGQTYIATQQYDTAIRYLQRAITLAEGHFAQIVSDAQYHLGAALYGQKRYKEAERMLLAGLASQREHKIKDKFTGYYSWLRKVYEATGNYRKALDYADTVASMKEALTGAEKAKVVNQMEIKYKTAEKDREIARHQLLIAQQNNKLERKNTWIAITAGATLLLLLASGARYRNIKHKERLQAEQIKTLQQQNTISILKGMVKGEDKERSRIARELHDGLGGMLSAAMMRLMSVRHELPAVTAEPAYQEAMDVLEQIGDEIRKTAHNLMPEVLLKQNLEDALRAHCSYVQAGKQFTVDFQSYGAYDHVNQDFKLNVYRIVQELLKNVTQHAEATHALVQLVVHEQTLTITVEDNGKGFVTDEATGMGLHNLQTRIKSLDGQYTIETAPGKGTSVFIELSLEQTTANSTV